MSYSKIVSLLGAEAESLLKHKCNIISKDTVRNPIPDYVDDFFIPSNRKPQISRMYSQLSIDHQIDQTKYRIANYSMGKAGSIISDGELKTNSDRVDCIAP